MKASATLALALLFSLYAAAQSPVQEVIDHALIQQTNTNTQNIMSMLQQQLDEAKKQSQSLNDQLTRMGDPSKVSLPALELIKEDIARSAAAAASGAQREARLRATTGSEAFGDNAYGLVPAVSETVTFKDGETGTRDPAKYKLQGALMGDLNALAEKSAQADERINALEDQRPAILDQLTAATDLATVMKLQAALSTIESQIASAKADVIKSKQDYDVLMEKLKLQSQIEARAKSEARTLERQHNSEKSKAAAAGASGSTGSGSGTPKKPFGNIGWGTKSSSN